MSELNTIEDCTIAPTVKIGKLVSLLKTRLDENAMIGDFSKMTYSTMGAFSYIGHNTTVINSDIEKFSSISWGVTIGPEEHDFSRLTNHSFLYSLKSFTLTPYKHYNPFEKECKIGNDVWIGCNSTILRGVKIGDGAVIGANSLVNKNVPPYAVVVGSPARIVKYRFDPAIIQALLELKWWDMPLEVISEHTELFAAHPTLETVIQLKKLKENNS